MNSPSCSLFFFEAETSKSDDRYKIFLDLIGVADREGYEAVWVPERHFMRFGGLFPSPSVAAAAAAAASTRLRIRAGSVVLPINDPIRVAEEWSMVDNLSGGRVDLAFASGWHPIDFCLAGDEQTYADRHVVLGERLAEFRRLWRGGTVQRRSGTGELVQVRTLPPPVQQAPGLWLTGGSMETKARAVEQEMNVLTANFRMSSIGELADWCNSYHFDMSQKYGHPGRVTLMTHTFVADHPSDLDRVAKPALSAFLAANIEMLKQSSTAEEMAGIDRLDGRGISRLVRLRVSQLVASPMSLIGDSQVCSQRLAALADAGVDEVACLMDFGMDLDETVASARRLGRLMRSVSGK